MAVKQEIGYYCAHPYTQWWVGSIVFNDWDRIDDDPEDASNAAIMAELRKDLYT